MEAAALLRVQLQADRRRVYPSAMVRFISTPATLLEDHQGGASGVLRDRRIGWARSVVDVEPEALWPSPPHPLAPWFS
jgi:hypothetical protein